MNSSPIEAELRDAMCQVARRLWECGLIGATEGNLSCRLNEGELLCTPAGVCKGGLNPAELAVVDLHGSPVRGEPPSSEIRLHLAIYRNRADCRAIVHAHPPHATALTLCGETIPEDVLPEAAAMLGPVALVPFGYPGTGEVADTIEPFLAGHKTFLLSHHGAATLGKSLLDACHRMEALERVARVVAIARTLGPLRRLPPEVRDRLRLAYMHGRLE